MQQVVKTDAVSKAVASMIRANGSKFFGVTFVKKDGTQRTLNGHVRKVEGKQGHNTTGHFEKYVNMETIISLSMGGRKMFFK